MDEKQSRDNTIKATITFTNGDQYTLTYCSDQNTDHRKYHHVNEEECQDEDADNKANREGICTFHNGNYFIGTFKGGKRHGHGILYKKSKKMQIGQWANDILTDSHLKITSNESHHSWKDEKSDEHLYDVCSDGHGNQYVGDILDGKAHGLGIRIWPDNEPPWLSGHVVRHVSTRYCVQTSVSPSME